MWIADVLNIVRWNGNTFRILCIPDGLRSGAIKEIWGESPNSVYVVGDFGTIVHYDGTSWQRVESGTTADIHDVWGSINPVNGQPMVLCAVSNRYTASERKLLRIYADGTVENLSWTPQQRLHAVWFKIIE